MFALMFALARMASAAWVGAAILFVIVAVDQAMYVKESSAFFLEKVPESPSTLAPAADAAPLPEGERPPVVMKALQVDQDVRIRLNAQFAERRFRLYYYTGFALVGLAWFSALFLRRRYLKASRWLLVMMFLSGAAGMMGYDWLKVYRPLRFWNFVIMDKPQVTEDTAFQTLHQHSRMVNGAQVFLTFMGSLLLCLPGTRPDAPTVMMKRRPEE